MRLSGGAVAAIAGFCGLIVLAGIGFAVWRSHRVEEAPDALLQRLPTYDAAVAWIDFDALRRGKYLSIFAGTKAEEEPEYTAFVHDTGFDYQRDLHHVVASFTPDGEFFLVRGAFDWGRIERYALHSKGACKDHLCHIPGSAADRKISFFPLQPDVLAMAVSSDEMAVTRLAKPGSQAEILIPEAPVWLSMSAGALRQAAALPGSTRAFASAIANARRVSLMIAPSGVGLEARLDALCSDAQQATALISQLRALTNMLRQGATKQPDFNNDRNIAGLLVAGTFDQAGSRVLGRWPIGRALLENLGSGM